MNCMCVSLLFDSVVMLWLMSVLVFVCLSVCYVML